MLLCRDHRRQIERCGADKYGYCTALSVCENPCAFYKAKSIRDVELLEIQKRGLAQKRYGM